MRISTYIPTWNRARRLTRALEALASMRIPPGVTWELVVVNNNCTDDTDDVIARFADRLPLRRVFEPTPGVSHARNAATNACHGEWLIALDDDALVHEDWLEAYVRAFRAHPEAWGFGGAVRPMLEEPSPAEAREIAAHCPAVFSAIDYGQENFALDETRRHLFFGNAALRCDIARRYPCDGELGRKAGSLVGGEDSELLPRMRRDGGTFWWVPDAPVDHLIAPERQTLAYFREYWRGRGRQGAIVDAHRTSPPQWKVPWWVRRSGWCQGVAATVARLLGRRGRSYLDPLLELSLAEGWVDQVSRATSGRGHSAR